MTQRTNYQGLAAQVQQQFAQLRETYPNMTDPEIMQLMEDTDPATNNTLAVGQTGQEQMMENNTGMVPVTDEHLRLQNTTRNDGVMTGGSRNAQIAQASMPTGTGGTDAGFHERTSRAVATIGPEIAEMEAVDAFAAAGMAYQPEPRLVNVYNALPMEGRIELLGFINDNFEMSDEDIASTFRD